MTGVGIPVNIRFSTSFSPPRTPHHPLNNFGPPLTFSSSSTYFSCLGLLFCWRKKIEKNISLLSLSLSFSLSRCSWQSVNELLAAPKLRREREKKTYDRSEIQKKTLKKRKRGGAGIYHPIRNVGAAKEPSPSPPRIGHGMQRLITGILNSINFGVPCSSSHYGAKFNYSKADTPFRSLIFPRPPQRFGTGESKMWTWYLWTVGVFTLFHFFRVAPFTDSRQVFTEFLPGSFLGIL